jgi:hypothetical protein
MGCCLCECDVAAADEMVTSVNEILSLWMTCRDHPVRVASVDEM